MARKPRLAAQAAAASIRTPTPLMPEISDEEMADAPPSGAMTPRDEDEEPVEEEEEEGEDGGVTPAQDSEPTSRPSTPQRFGRTSAIPQKRRRLGRPPKNRPPDWDVQEDNNDLPSDAGTPRRRGRGRPSAGVGRWGKPRGGPSHVTQTPIDKEGNMMDVINDEVDLPEDPDGETKVDKLGNLQGGREYRVRIFTIYDRGDRQYMLSTEPARCIGFRDSYLFFQKHKLLFKIIIGEDEKRDLIDREIIPHSYKGRAIGVVTARSVFREFGAKIIIGGRKVIDDYGVKAARERGDVEGELAVPEDKLPPPGEPYNRNQYVAWHGASSVYHSGAPSVPMPNGKVPDGKKRKVIVTGDNWMFEHAREASRYNAALAALRRQNLEGTYDIHTNIMQYPKVMQPTHARWEPVKATAHHQLANGDSHLLTNGTSGSENVAMEESGHEDEIIFPDLAPVYSRNFMIHDVYLEGAPYSGIGTPGPDGDIHDIGSNGLDDIQEDVLAELPPECRQVFDEARDRELEWKSKWRSEAANGNRAQFLPTYTWFP